MSSKCLALKKLLCSINLCNKMPFSFKPAPTPQNLQSCSNNKHLLVIARHEAISPPCHFDRRKKFLFANRFLSHSPLRNMANYREHFFALHGSLLQQKIKKPKLTPNAQQIKKPISNYRFLKISISTFYRLL